MKLNRTGSNWTELELNKINENWDRLEQLGDSVTDLVLESGGDSNLEVVQARGGERVLNDRLDKMDAHFADIERKKATYAYVVGEIIQAKTEMESYVDNAVEQLGSMSPKGAFATLQELQNTYPDGAEGVFIVQESGDWYYWDGSAWTDGGEYQATPWDEFMTEQDEEWVI